MGWVRERGPDRGVRTIGEEVRGRQFTIHNAQVTNCSRTAFVQSGLGQQADGARSGSLPQRVAVRSVGAGGVCRWLPAAQGAVRKLGDGPAREALVPRRPRRGSGRRPRAPGPDALVAGRLVGVGDRRGRRRASVGCQAARRPGPRVAPPDRPRDLRSGTTAGGRGHAGRPRGLVPRVRLIDRRGVVPRQRRSCTRGRAAVLSRRQLSRRRASDRLAGPGAGDRRRPRHAARGAGLSRLDADHSPGHHAEEPPAPRCPDRSLTRRRPELHTAPWCRGASPAPTTVSMNHDVPATGGMRLSEVLSGLSYALDLTEGQRPGHAVRSCLIGMRLAQEINLPYADRSALFYALLMKDLGCSSNAARFAALFGANDHDVKNAIKHINWAHALEAFRLVARNAAPGQPVLKRVWRLLAILAHGPEGAARGGADALRARRRHREAASVGGCHRGGDPGARRALGRARPAVLVEARRDSGAGARAGPGADRRGLLHHLRGHDRLRHGARRGAARGSIPTSWTRWLSMESDSGSGAGWAARTTLTRCAPWSRPIA